MILIIKWLEYTTHHIIPTSRDAQCRLHCGVYCTTVHGTECEHAYNLFEVILDLGRCLFVVGSK